ncbi:MAG: TonB-dependent receptor [Prevotellaceae bacterium]|jgi:TonB-linked SusC/RagA family outer membrane protein|nr:TonB-dependent receptor [Prevotellaceae bacterium]
MYLIKQRKSGLKKLLQIVACMMFLIPSGLLAQTEGRLTIKGTVSDVDGPLIGVTVVVTGSTVAVTTDADGNYSIVVPNENAEIAFSYIGYKTMTEQVGRRSIINVIMDKDVSLIDELVVVGYGTQRKIDVTGAITSVGEQTIKEVPVANISQAMQGRIAGVNVQQTSTRPGQVPQLRIRGTRSLSASNDPLIVLDGVPFDGTINDIDPNNIKSLDILKDASSSAIYGARGANGVIIITTYRGILTERPQVAYNGYFGVGSAAKRYTLYSPEEFLELRRASNYNGGNLYADEQAMYDAGRSTDWQDLMYQTSYRTNHEVTINSGSEYTQLSLSGGYYKESAIVPGPLFQRLSLRVTVDQKINDRVKIGLNSLNTYGITDGESANVMYSILTLTPFTDPYNADGSINVAPREAYNADPMRNPLLIKDPNTWKEQRTRFNSFNTFYAEVKITDGLRYRLNAGLNYWHDNYGSFYDTDSPMKNGGISDATVNNTKGTGYLIDNLIYYDKTIADKHRLSFTGLAGVQENSSWNTSATARDMVANYIYYYNLGLSNEAITIDPRLQADPGRRLASFMLRGSYTYDDKYMLTLTGRYDGSSVLSPGHQWHLYKSISAGWNINKEKFLADVSWLSNLKIRGGYGETSNEAVPPYSTLVQLTPNYYNFGAVGAYGYYKMNLKNDNLDWEYTNSYSMGVDFGFLNNRITGSIDLYFQQTKKILLEQALPYTTGILSNYLNNVGQTQNKGIELSVHSVNFKSEKGFNWDMDVNFYLNRSKIIALNAGVDRNEGNGWFVGSPIDVIYDYKQIGIWQLGEEDEAAVYGAFPGRSHIEDVNKDNQITDLDKQIIGSFEPDFEFGWSNRFYYKGFDLTLVTYGKVGGMLVSSIHQGQSYVNQMNGRRNGIKVNYWTETNPSNEFPGVTGNGDYPPYPSVYGYFDASFFKIRTITLGYDLPNKWIKSLGLKSLRAYITVDNVCTLFSPYVKAGGLDPEPTGYGSQTFVDGYATGAIAQARQLTIGPAVPPSRYFIFGINIKY